MICQFVAFQSSLLSYEMREAILDFALLRFFEWVQNQVRVFDVLQFVADSKVFCRQCEQEGLAATSVCQGVEDVEYDAIVVCAYLK